MTRKKHKRNFRTGNLIAFFQSLIKLDTGINDKLHGPNGIPKIDFDTQMAVVIVNLGSQSKPRIVTKV